MGKGSGRRPLKTDKAQFESNWDSIFGKKEDKNFKETQQDLTELNGDGNRQRGHYGEDESQEAIDPHAVPKRD